MDPFNSPPADTLAAARLHVQALTDCGLPREALLRALLENYGDGNTSSNATTPGIEGGGFPQQPQQSPQPLPTQLQQQQQQQPGDHQQQQQQQHQPQLMGQKLMQNNYGFHQHNTRLSISTTSSNSSGRASILSTATTMSSVSSQAGGLQHEIATPLSTPPAPPVKSNRGTSKPQGAYWCTFCDVAFQRKFDWKRHEDEFHERYKRYPCPNCNRIFWGANTFNQHHKNAHGCTTCPHADRVVQYTQRKTAWACGFCGGFLASRDRYFDHVARHYEDGCNKSHWNHSLVIYGLLHQPSITHAWKELDAALYGHLPRDKQPMLEWDVKLTGHAQGFLEGESPGKLQDLLEFFNESNDDPRFLARLAHDSATIRPRNEATMAGLIVIPRPISEPPKSKPIAKAMPMKHMSTPHPEPPPAYHEDGGHVLKRQRSIAPSLAPSVESMDSFSKASLASYTKPTMDAFSKPTIDTYTKPTHIYNPQTQPPPPQPQSHLQQQQQQRQQQQQQPESHKMINNPFHQPMMGMQATAASGSFYDLNITHVHPHMQGQTTVVPGGVQLQPHPQQQQPHPHPHHHHQQQQHMLAPLMFDDWSSIAGTVVDDQTWWQTTGHHGAAG